VITKNHNLKLIDDDVPKKNLIPQTNNTKTIFSSLLNNVPQKGNSKINLNINKLVEASEMQEDNLSQNMLLEIKNKPNQDNIKLTKDEKPISQDNFTKTIFPLNQSLREIKKEFSNAKFSNAYSDWDRFRKLKIRDKLVIKK
jgi:hypothetical protein